MNELPPLEKTPTKIHIMKTNKISHHRKAKTNQKHKGWPQEQIKKTTTKNAFFSFLLFNLKKNPEQILTAVAVRVLIVDISKSFLNHLLWYKSWECHLTTFYSSPAVVGNKIMHNAHNRTNVSFQVFFKKKGLV